MDAEVASFCAIGTAAGCQHIIGEALASGSFVEPARFAACFAAVPPPVGYSDAAMAAFILLRFVQNLGTAIHRQVHVRGVGECRFDPEVYIPPVHVDISCPSAWHPAPAFAHWASRFTTALGEGHDLASARARFLMSQDLARALNLDALARDAATSPSVMRRRFLSISGETPLQYRTRLRALEAVRLIREGWKRDAVAATVGWKSPKDIYRALRVLAGVSPSQVRTMSADQVRDLTSRLSRGPE